MEWIEENDGDYIFGLPGNATLDALVAKTADNLRFHHAKSRQEKVRTHTSFTYQAGSWTHPRKVVARLECSLQPDAGETTTNGMRQEVDIRYVVTSLKGSAEYLYEDVYCERGQMENLIKLHKAQLSSDRMSCHSATANQVRLALHTAAYWLMLGVRDAIQKTEPLAKAEFATIRERLFKIGARVVEHAAHPHPIADRFPGGALIPRRRVSPCAIQRMSGGASCPAAPPSEADQPQTRCTVSCRTPVRSDRLVAFMRRADVQKRAKWCMIRASTSSQ
jgi:DDE family transposase